jgi:4,5:9,10-diseco-3-hydroxy-5,9,17-trioxoandrosta-1(10),2-diene-4-oate hydrolase
MTDTLYAVANGYEINVSECGPADGVPVVFLHGSGPGASGKGNFRDNSAAFVAAGYRVVMPDLIGYGASSKPEGIDYTLDLFVETVVDALGQHGITSAHLVGNSLGGGIAIQIALSTPKFAKSLVLMAPGCIAEQASYFTMPGIAKMKSSFGSPDFNLDEQRNLVANLLHPDWADRIPEELVKQRFEIARTQPKDVLARMKTPNLGPRLGELQCPIFVLWGLNDEFCPESHARLFLDHCDDVRCITFSRTGHWVQVERPEEFNSYVIGFLNERA